MHTYSHAWVLLYAFIYFPWFTYLERHVTDNYFVIHSVFDDYIPFCEYFIIPYLLWFAYIAVTLGYLFFNDKQGFYKASRDHVQRYDHFSDHLHGISERTEPETGSIYA